MSFAQKKCAIYWDLVLAQDDLFSDGASSPDYEPMETDEPQIEPEKEATPPAKKVRLSCKFAGTAVLVFYCCFLCFFLHKMLSFCSTEACGH